MGELGAHGLGGRQVLCCPSLRCWGECPGGAAPSLCPTPRQVERWVGSSEEGDRVQSGQGVGGREAPKPCTTPPQHHFGHRVSTKTPSLLAVPGQPLYASLGQPTWGGSTLGGQGALGVPPWGAERAGHPSPSPGPPP